MPFQNLDEVEFNFIWVGGNPMPEEQAANVINFILNTNKFDPNHLPKVRIWVDNRATYDVIIKHFNSLLAKINKRLPSGTKPFTFKDSLPNLSFKTINDAELETPPELKDLIERTRAAKLWGGLSDIYRLLILSRKYTGDGPHARFYVEGDNKMLPPLWEFFKTRSVANVYNSEFGSRIFVPCDMRTDLLFLDITSEQGAEFADKMRPNLLKVLIEDPIMKTCWNELQEQAIKQGGLAEDDVLGSYGMLVLAMFRSCFMTDDATTQFGFKGITVPLAEIKHVHGPLPSIAGAQGLSWLDKKNPKEDLYGSALMKIMYLRIISITDVDGLALKKSLERLGYASFSQLLDDAAIILPDLQKKKSGKSEIPSWFLKVCELYKQAEADVVVAGADEAPSTHKLKA